MRNLVLSLVSALLGAVLPAQATEVRIHETGNGCGATLVGSATLTGSRVDLTLEVRGGFANQFGFFVLGANSIEAAIPFYGCTLFVQPVATTIVQADALGRSRLSLVASTAFVGTLYAQGAAFRLVPNELHATNALEIRFKN